MDERRKLVVFDVEGVLLPKNRYLIFEVGRKLSLLQFVRSLVIGFLYRMGLLSLESALKNIFEMFRGLSIDELVETFRQMPLLPDTEEVFAQLKVKHLKTALISSGLPQVIVNDLASRLQTDYAFGLNLCTDNGILTGDIEGDVIEKSGKALVVNRIMVKERLAKQNLVVVADDRNNSPIFYPEALKVGFNPDFLIALKSDHVINESLLQLLPIIDRGHKKPAHSLTRNEVIREAIHASGFLWALAATVFGVLSVIVGTRQNPEKKNTYNLVNNLECHDTFGTLRVCHYAYLPRFRRYTLAPTIPCSHQLCVCGGRLPWRQRGLSIRKSFRKNAYPL
jgi:phosphoserine phosphatase